MDFVVNKVLKRSITALLGPVLLYSGVFNIGKLIGQIPNNTEFMNQIAVTALLGVGVVVSRIGLYITLRPVEAMFDWLLWTDNSKNFALRGNFAPIEKEWQYEIEPGMIKEGAIPNDINGVFLRNGPNPLFMPPHGRHHWFDGDGHIHGFRLKNGKAFYCNRQTQCAQHEDQAALGRQVNAKLGTLASLPGLFQAMLLDYERKIGYLPDRPAIQRYSANTAISTHAKHTWGLVEADLPFEVRVDKNEKDFDIKSIGYDDFNGQLTHAVSAHPKVDRKTGHFMAFGYDRVVPVVHYSLFDKERKLLSYIKIPITSVRMLHDFAATENYVIIPDLPMEANAEKNCIKDKRFIYQLNKNLPARYGILKRFSTNPEETQWFELPCHYCFHYGNAWEEKNEKGEDLVILWGCRADDIDIEFRMEHPFLADNWNTKTTRFEFNLTTGKAKQVAFIPSKSTEFPIVNQDELGYKTKYMYFALDFEKVEDSQAARDNVIHSGFIKVDTDTKQIVGEISFGQQKSGGEIFFQPRDEATSEDDGYCMTFVHHWETDTSEFIMWDAKTMSSTPVLRAGLKQRVPNGFHGMFVHEDELV